MNNNFEKAKDQYNNTHIPEELELLTSKTIKKSKVKNLNKQISFLAIASSIAFVVSINVSPTVYAICMDIPVINTITQIFTLEKQEEMSKVYDLKFEVPNVIFEDKDLEKRINEEIELRIEEAKKSGILEAQEYYDAYTETGGDAETFRPILVDIGYETRYISDETLSFMIYKVQTVASAYNELYFYNIDTKTGQDITFESILGENYKDTIEEQVMQVINKEIAENENHGYFIEAIEEIIRKNEDFYINENGNIVVVFEKYEIAAGAVGSKEFEIIAQ